MKRSLLPLLASTAFILTGCANFIREEPTVISDVVPGTEKLLVDDLDIDGATAELKLRFVANEQLYSIVNIRETPYEIEAELYEVPIGLVTLPFTFIYYVGAELISLGAASEGTSSKPMFWSVEGLNPFQNVERGMFGGRETLREKKGSRVEQDNSQPKPYDAVVSVEEGVLDVAFSSGKEKKPKFKTIEVGEELLIPINLLEASEVMPSADATRILVQCAVRPNPEGDSFEKEVTFDIPASLARKIFDSKEIVELILEGGVSKSDETEADFEARIEAAIQELEALGFEREASEMRFYRR